MSDLSPEARDLFKQAISALSGTQKECVLEWCNGHTFKEIGQKHGKSLERARQIVMHGVWICRNELERDRYAEAKQQKLVMKHLGTENRVAAHLGYCP